MSESPPVDSLEFQEFWSAYPRRCGKGAARRSWDTALKKTTARAILAALRGQIEAEVFSTDVQFVAHPATWLNQERWSDDIVPRRTPMRNGALAALERMHRGEFDFGDEPARIEAPR